jgi:hypothetical protein
MDEYIKIAINGNIIFEDFTSEVIELNISLQENLEIEAEVIKPDPPPLYVDRFLTGKVVNQLELKGSIKQKIKLTGKIHKQ